MRSATIGAGAGPAHENNAGRDWFTAAELAELHLPGLPTDKRSMNRRIRDERWHLRVDGQGALLCRPRTGRGGGTEFHVSLLPGPARLDLAQRGLVESRPGPTEAETASAGLWRWFEGQPDKVKAVARERLAIVMEIATLEESGETRSAALATASRRHGTGVSTLWGWMGMVAGLARSDWLPALAPRRRGGGAEADIDPELWLIFKSDFLRPEEPTLTSCYERISEIAADRGLSLPSERTMRRRLEKDIDPIIALRLRKGAEAAKRAIPAQRRTVDQLQVLECVNIDGHKFDVRVIARDGKVMRPMLVGIQDVRSSKLLAWRVCETESAHHVRLVFADLFERVGVPVHVVLDNGRGFASKWITGGAKHRFRFKVKDEDPVGLLVDMGCQTHWALPYHGQAKPIERAWRDLTDRIARHPFVSGAYTGPSPTKKPANYGSREIGWDAFVAHVERCVAKHNAKLGRRGRDYRGRSFDQVFEEGLATARIRKASPEQLRMALLAAERKTVRTQDGVVELFGNRYWSEACMRLRGERVTVRFDPDDLEREVHLFDAEGRYLTSAQIHEDAQFLSAEAAKKTAKFNAEQRRKIREGVEAEELLTAAQVAALQPDAPATRPVPQPKVVQLIHRRGNTAAAVKVNASPDIDARRERDNRMFTALSLVRPVE